MPTIMALAAVLSLASGRTGADIRQVSRHGLTECRNGPVKNRQQGGTGSGKATEPNARQKRNLRWRLVFDTKDAEDYAKQLEDLGAILAVPEEKGGYRVFRDLKQRPAKGKVEDLKTIKRIFWIDDAPKSVASLAKALQLKAVPKHIICFFPEKLEKELLDKELKYQKRKEDEIAETRFKVIRREGKYDVEVTEQKLKEP